MYYLHYITTPLCPLRVIEQSVNFIPQAALGLGERNRKHLKKKKQKHIETSRSSPGEPAGKERGVFRNNGLGDINIMVQLITIKIDKVGFSDRVIVVVATYMCTMLGKQDGNLMDSLTH